MKLALAILGIAVIALAVLFYNAEQAADQRQIVASNQLAAAHAQIESARAEVAVVRTQMETQVSQLQQAVSSLDAEKAHVQEQLHTLTNELEATRTALEQNRVKLDGLEKRNEVLNEEIRIVSGNLVVVKEELAALGQTHATTVGHLTAMREDYVRLTKEKTVLEAKLHDLNALKAQINMVKQELHEQKVEERKRLDRAEAALGNGGFLMKEGKWVAAPTPGKYPLIQEIQREQ